MLATDTWVGFCIEMDANKIAVKRWGQAKIEVDSVTWDTTHIHFLYIWYGQIFGTFVSNDQRSEDVRQTVSLSHNSQKLWPKCTQLESSTFPIDFFNTLFHPFSSLDVFFFSFYFFYLSFYRSFSALYFFSSLKAHRWLCIKIENCVQCSRELHSISLVPFRICLVKRISCKFTLIRYMLT